MAVQPTPSQVNAIKIAERVTSIFSLFGILFILSTFLLGRGFDKPINRLFFFASFSNLGMNIAALMAEDGIAAGQDSSLCQFQAFAIQWFLGVDVLWALCMGVNVYLALFCGWSSERMRRQEWKYFIGCYGCSFVPALVYLFIKSKDRGRIYGPALLWCWVSPKWDFLRVATLYGVVWVALLFAMTIYILAFRQVWKNRHQLQGLFNPFNENPFQGTVTTEVNITTHARYDSSSSHQKSTPSNPSSSPSNPSSTFQSPTEPTTNISTNNTRSADFDPYTVNIEVGPYPHPQSPSSSFPPAALNLPTLTRTHALSTPNPEAWLYARVAFLFFLALLVSWVPSSVNRLYSLVHPDRYNFGLNFTEALVLPLQGFVNAGVYVLTSRTACGRLWREGWLGRRGSGVGTSAREDGDNDAMGLGQLRTEGKVERSTIMGLGVSGSKKGKGKGEGGGGGSRLQRFTSRRGSRRLGSEGSSVASLRDH